MTAVARRGLDPFRSTMSNSNTPSRHDRKPGNDDAELHSRDALRVRVILHALRKLASNGREAMSLLPKISLLPKEGGGAPNGAPIPVAAPRCAAQPRPDKRGRSPSALLRGHAPGFYSPTYSAGCASWNHRMQTGGPFPAPVQRAPRSPARAGRADTQTACRLRATNSARRNRTRSVSRRHRLTSLTTNRMDAKIKFRARAVKGFSIYADKSRACAARLPLCASPDVFHSTLKIRKSEVVPVNQGFLCCANLCAAARRRPNGTAVGRFPLVPAKVGPVWIPACAGMSGARFAPLTILRLLGIVQVLAEN